MRGSEGIDYYRPQGVRCAATTDGKTYHHLCRGSRRLVAAILVQSLRRFFMKRTLTTLLLGSVLTGVVLVGQAQGAAGTNSPLLSAASSHSFLPLYQRYGRYRRVHYRPRYRRRVYYYRPRRRAYYRPRYYYRRRSYPRGYDRRGRY